jgi:hypothetical protein
LCAATTKDETGAGAGGCDTGKKWEVVETSLEITCDACLALWSMPDARGELSWAVGTNPERDSKAAKMRLKLDAEAARIGCIFAATPLNFKKK